jgi:hypothetical protein
MNVCRSELLNHGQKFSLTDYKEKRVEVKKYLKEKLSQRFEKDYGILLNDIFIEQITFEKVINDLNLKRILNDIYNEKAEYEKDVALIFKETEFEIKKLQDQALAISKMAEHNGTNEILKIEKTQFKANMEFAHLEGLTSTLTGLNFPLKSSINDTKRALSYCWVSSLSKNENLKIFNPNAESGSSNMNPFENANIGIMI